MLTIIQTYGVRIPLDMIYAVQVEQWPPEATEWVQRVKKGNWLGDELLIESVLLEGCQVVPVAHKHSLNPDRMATFFCSYGKKNSKECCN